MANTLTAVTPKLLAQGLMALRQNCTLPRLMNRKYEAMAGQKGSTIDVPIPSAIAVQAVSPGATPPATADVAPTSVAIALDQWYEAPFYLTDQDMLQAMEGTIPMQASEAIKALCNKVHTQIFSNYTRVYGFAGTPGTTPFNAGTTADATSLRLILNKQLAPLTDRHVVFDPDAEAKALSVTAFQNGQYSGDYAAIREGNLNRKFGFDWWMDQIVPTHTAGTAAAATVTNNADVAVGATTIQLKVSASTATLVVGDIITKAGDSQTYVVTAAATLDTTGVAVSVQPPIAVATAGGTTPVNVTVKASHVVNLGFHRDAFAFASRPLEADAQGLGAIIQSAVDPVSGLALRLEITREHKRTRFSYDMLWGSQIVRRELAARLAG